MSTAPSSRSCCASCCTFPNGIITLIPAALSTAIAILSTSSWASCQYAKVQEESSDTWYDIGLFVRQMEDAGDVALGAWYGTTDSGCIAYSSLEQDLQDSKFKGAQALALLASAIGWIMMVVVWSISPCVKFPQFGWKVIGIVFLLMGLFQMLSLLMLSSNVCRNCGWSQEMADAGLDCVSTCDISTGGIVAIITALLSWFTGAVCFKVRDAEREEGVSNLSQVHEERAIVEEKQEKDADTVEHDQEAMETNTLDTAPKEENEEA